MKNLLLFIFLLVTSMPAFSVEHDVRGLIDLRSYKVTGHDKANSYLTGDYGKFRFDDGSGLALGQLGIQYQITWENNLSARVVANAYSDTFDTALGITEAFIQYRSLPSQSGIRHKAKFGIFYPLISLENTATAWSSPYSITSSALNNWVGEELRHTGVAFSIEKLGKFTQSPHDFLIDMTLFQNNDTAGAMLTWHGWTVGSRQSLLQEKLVVQNFPARQHKLSEQAAESDPFLELDNRWGSHLVAKWSFKRRNELSAGYYNNNAEKGLVEQGQYTWTTHFYHVGLKTELAKGTELIGQFMAGNTLMTSLTNESVVDNDFSNAFVMIRKKQEQHHIALRVEQFDVDDLDNTLGDNNNEKGKSVSVSYRYQIQRSQFVLAEYNWLSSERWSRTYVGQPADLIERQLQLAYRHYF